MTEHDADVYLCERVRHALALDERVGELDVHVTIAAGKVFVGALAEGKFGAVTAETGAGPQLSSKGWATSETHLIVAKINFAFQM